MTKFCFPAGKPVNVSCKCPRFPCRHQSDVDILIDRSAARRVNILPKCQTTSLDKPRLSFPLSLFVFLFPYNARFFMGPFDELELVIEQTAKVFHEV